MRQIIHEIENKCNGASLSVSRGLRITIIHDG